MTNGNHEPEHKKKCPLLNDWCIGEACAWDTPVFRNMGGMRQMTNMCAIHAMLTIFSEINAKTQPPQPKIELPHLRG